MVVPKIQSVHNSEARNIINKAIEVLNVHGKTIQDLVADGQLTEEQYASLITTINGMLKSGEVDRGDLTPELRDEVGKVKNKIDKGEVIKTDLSPELKYEIEKKRDRNENIGLNDVDAEFLAAIADGGATQFNLLSIPRVESVSPETTTFFDIGKNLFDKDAASIGYILNDATGDVTNAPEFYTSDYIRKVAGRTYTIFNAVRIVQYNETKNFNEGARQSSGPYTFTAEMDGYFKFSTHRDFSIDTAQVELGTSITEYEPYRANIKLDALGSVGEAVKKMSQPIPPERTTFFDVSKNLFNPEKAVQGYFLNDRAQGELVELAGYVTSDFMPMEQNRDVHLNMAYTIIYYDENQNYQSGLRLASNMPYTFKPAHDGYFRYSFNTELKPINQAQAEYGSTETSFEPHYVKINDKYLEDPENPLFGKALLNFGDSIASAQTDGVDGYHEIIAEKNKMQLTNYAQNGAKVTVIDGETNHIKNQIDQAIADGAEADYILFDGLRNDVMNDLTTYGSVTDAYDSTLDLGTFCGAFEHYCRTLRENWLDAKIIFVRTHNTRTVSHTRQKELGEYALEICEKYSIAVADIWKEGGLNTQFSGFVGPYTLTETDATHPNTAGYDKFYVPIIEAKMKSI